MRGRADDAERQAVTVAISGAERDELPSILVGGDALGGRNGSGVAERHGGRRGFVPGGSRGVCRAVRVVVVLEQGDRPGAGAEWNGGGELAGGDGGRGGRSGRQVLEAVVLVVRLHARSGRGDRPCD